MVTLTAHSVYHDTHYYYTNIYDMHTLSHSVMIATWRCRQSLGRQHW